MWSGLVSRNFNFGQVKNGVERWSEKNENGPSEEEGQEVFREK